MGQRQGQGGGANQGNPNQYRYQDQYCYRNGGGQGRTDQSRYMQQYPQPAPALRALNHYHNSSLGYNPSLNQKTETKTAT